MLAILGRQRAVVLQLGEAECQNAGKGRSHAADEVENGITLLQVVSGIPTAQQVCATWKETGLEHSENETERNEISPFGNESKADHGDTPEKGDRWQKEARAEFSENDSRRWLQEDVCNEEDQNHDGVPVAD